MDTDMDNRIKYSTFSGERPTSGSGCIVKEDIKIWEHEADKFSIKSREITREEGEREPLECLNS
jgi:hypothetical protein